MTNMNQYSHAHAGSFDWSLLLLVIKYLPLEMLKSRLGDPDLVLIGVFYSFY
jgi:hypothetical protein